MANPRNGCRHDYQPLAPRPFQTRPGAAWLVMWCRHCGVMSFGVRNPCAREPLVEQQQWELPSVTVTAVPIPGVAALVAPPYTNTLPRLV